MTQKENLSLIPAGNNEIQKTNIVTPILMSVDEIVEAQERPSIDFLPYVYITNDKNSPKGAPQRQLFITVTEDGEKTTRPVKTPYLLSYILVRPTYRQLEGSSYKKRFYNAYPGTKGKTAQDFEEIVSKMTDTQINQEIGYTYLFYLVENCNEGIKQENVHIVTHEAFGSMKSYLARALAKGKASEGMGSVITLISHEENVRISEKGYKYLDSSKFTQFSSRALTDKEKTAMKKVFEAEKERLEFFMSM